MALLVDSDALPCASATGSGHHTRSLYFKNERVTTLNGRRKPLGLLHPWPGAFYYDHWQALAGSGRWHLPVLSLAIALAV